MTPPKKTEKDRFPIDDILMVELHDAMKIEDGKLKSYAPEAAVAAIATWMDRWIKQESERPIASQDLFFAAREVHQALTRTMEGSG